MTMGVYAIRCNVNNRLYVGCSESIERRWNHHCDAMRCGYKHVTSEAMRIDWNAYGRDAFELIVLEHVADANDLVHAESRWIAGLVRLHGRESFYNRHFPIEVRHRSAGNAEVGARLRSLRTERNMTQVQLADAATVGSSTICAIEAGRYPVSERTARKLAAALEVEPEELIDDTRTA